MVYGQPTRKDANVIIQEAPSQDHKKRRTKTLEIYSFFFYQVRRKLNAEKRFKWRKLTPEDIAAYEMQPRGHASVRFRQHSRWYTEAKSLQTLDSLIPVKV